MHVVCLCASQCKCGCWEVALRETTTKACTSTPLARSSLGQLARSTRKVITWPRSESAQINAIAVSPTVSSQGHHVRKHGTQHNHAYPTLPYAPRHRRQVVQENAHIGTTPKGTIPKQDSCMSHHGVSRARGMHPRQSVTGILGTYDRDIGLDCWTIVRVCTCFVTVCREFD